ncbi:MAG: hypothetical protein HOG66_10125, partial [Flavobacteriales bacterium]|nr:hypothetical protein [Flavobacteriales bacterium]
MPNLLKNKEDQEVRTGKPDWLKVKIPSGKEYLKIKSIVEEKNLNTICSSGKCPNQSECWSAGTATFMILGNTCTRSCQFCNVDTGAGEEVDIFEPAKVAESVRQMGLKHAVITSVDRDDLPDGGAEHWKKTIQMNSGIFLPFVIFGVLYLLWLRGRRLSAHNDQSDHLIPI